MDAAHTLAPTPQEGDQQATPVPDGMRRCLVTGDVLQKDDLIRFVIGPDHSIVPDLAQKLPGRGLWVTATFEAITTAAKKNLFAKAAKESVKADAGLADQVVFLMHKRALDFLGLARSAGITVLGQPQVEAALKAHKLDLVLLASDTKSNLSSFRARNEVDQNRRFNRNELGAALGHDQLVYIGLMAHSLTTKLQTALKQLEKLIPDHHISQDNG